MPFAVIYDEFLDRITRDQLSGANQQVDLFTNDYIPDRGDNIVDMVIAAYAGYVQQTWVVNPYSLVSHKEQWAPAVMSFPTPTAGGATDVYGFVVRATFNTGGARVVMAARFADAPIALAEGGAALVFTTFLRWFDAHL